MVLVVEYEVDDEAPVDGVLDLMIRRMRQGGYLDGTDLAPGVLLAGLHAATYQDAEEVMVVFERDSAAER